MTLVEVVADIRAGKYPHANMALAAIEADPDFTLRERLKRVADTHRNCVDLHDCGFLDMINELLEGEDPGMEGP